MIKNDGVLSRVYAAQVEAGALMSLKLCCRWCCPFRRTAGGLHERPPNWLLCMGLLRPPGHAPQRSLRSPPHYAVYTGGAQGFPAATPN